MSSVSFPEKSMPMAAEDRHISAENGFKAESRADGEIDDHGELQAPEQIPIIPGVRKCSLVDFKNHFNATKDGIFAVDVLLSDSFLDQEVQAELKCREDFPRRNKKNRNKHGGIISKIPKRSIRVGQAEHKLISRIRIQSPALLSILSRIMNEGWDSRPRTFLRPFRQLISYHSKVCETLRELEIKWGQAIDGLDAARTPASLDGIGDQGGDDQGITQIHDSAAAVTELRGYVEFMSRDIMPLYHQFEKLNETSNAKVRFDDLWYLFKVGDLIYRPRGSGADKEIDNSALGNGHWRCYGVRPPWPRYRLRTTDLRKYANNDDESEVESFGVLCYYIDYTGDEFCVVTEIFEIPRYDGERPVKSLTVFPQRFLSNHEAKFKASTESGRAFLRIIETRHAAYNWWTSTRDPKGDPTTDIEGNILKRPEYINSEVIVDFVEAFQACPSWKPVPSILKPEETTRSTTFDDFYTFWWSDSNRTNLLATTTEVIVLKSGVTSWERNKYVLEDPLLVSIRENDKSNTPTTVKFIRESDLIILPGRLFAYVLRDRKFVQLTVQRINAVKPSSNAFTCLKIHDSHKDMIQSLVEDHFRKKMAEKRDSVERPTLDWIRGKGKGLIILLHGVPGVGKTATAEAVAQASGKPLFSITCGDLGLTPSDVEIALQRIFRLAHTWDCVLLLDEVDAFFSQRSKGDDTLAKNALVSVFLRVLEYYDGLLFLTTNRPGALDEAFRSRLHLTLYYPPLNYQQTKDIWKLNIDRLRSLEKDRSEDSGHEPLQINEQEILRFAKERFNQDRGRFRWNGRQIRNAFQIASSLAHFDARKDDVSPRLTAEHFKMIHLVTEDFDRYMQEAKGKTDGELAFDRGDRADHWDPETDNTEGMPHSYEAPPSPGGPRSAGPMGIKSWQTYSRRRPVSPFGRNPAEPTSSSHTLHPPSPRLGQHRSGFGQAPSIAVNDNAPFLNRNRDVSPRRRFNDHLAETAYNDSGSDNQSPEFAGGYEGLRERLGNLKRGSEESHHESPDWRKRRRESDKDV